jgi:hypothetical protein
MEGGGGRRQCGGSVSCEGRGWNTRPMERSLRTEEVVAAVLSALGLKEG